MGIRRHRVESSVAVDEHLRVVGERIEIADLLAETSALVRCGQCISSNGGGIAWCPALQAACPFYENLDAVPDAINLVVLASRT